MFQNERFLLGCLAFLVAANAFVYRPILIPRALEVSVLETGKGGWAALVRHPDGAALLFNTGPDASILRALGEEFPPWRRTIDAVLLSDVSAKTSGGLPDVFRRYRVLSLLRPERVGARSAETALASSIRSSAPPRLVSIPQDARITLDRNVSVSVVSSDMFFVSFGTAVLLFSSSTPAGVYAPEGNTLTRIR